MVNINTASQEMLEALPEIGPVKAQAIINNRPYKKIDDIMKVKGIKEGTFSKIKDIDYGELTAGRITGNYCEVRKSCPQDLFFRGSFY